MVRTDFSPIETCIDNQINYNQFQNTRISHIEKPTHSTDINKKQKSDNMNITVIKKPFSLKNKRIIDMINRIDDVYTHANSVLQTIYVNINKRIDFSFKPDQTHGMFVIFYSQNEFSITKELRVSEAELIKIIHKRKTKIP